VNRYHITAYYQDRTDSAQVAQELVVLAENPHAAVEAAGSTLRPLASGRHIVAFQFGETGPIQPGVVHVGDPYIPLHWPLTNRIPPSLVHHEAQEPAAASPLPALQALSEGSQ
jgi:hypothetical protein